jgi:hypothetical protein
VTQLWAEPEDPNLAAALGGYVGAGAPLVAGFELAAVVLMLSSTNVAQDFPLVGPAVVAMVLSAAFMVFSIRYGFWAVSYWTTPAERLMWNPAAVIDMAPLDRERRRLAGRMAYFRTLRRRANNLFELGLIVFLAAVALMLIPDRWHAQGPGWRWAAAGVAVLALVIHVVWTIGRWFHDHVGSWHQRLKKRSKHDKDVSDRAARALGALDTGVVKGLGIIWPPVHPAEFEQPSTPQTADLQGIRKQ